MKWWSYWRLVGCTKKTTQSFLLCEEKLTACVAVCIELVCGMCVMLYLYKGGGKQYKQVPRAHQMKKRALSLVCGCVCAARAVLRSLPFPSPRSLIYSAYIHITRQ
jgi:hypothetical protein